MTAHLLTVHQLWQHLALNDYAARCGGTDFPYPTGAILGVLAERVGADGVARTARFFTEHHYSHADIAAIAFTNPTLLTEIATGGHDRDGAPTGVRPPTFPSAHPPAAYLFGEDTCCPACILAALTDSYSDEPSVQATLRDVISGTQSVEWSLDRIADVLGIDRYVEHSFPNSDFPHVYAAHLLYSGEDSPEVNPCARCDSDMSIRSGALPDQSRPDRTL